MLQTKLKARKHLWLWGRNRDCPASSGQHVTFPLVDKFDNIGAEVTPVGKDTIEVPSPLVKSPKFVRFAWHNYSKHNLVNLGDLPAVPFRTDEQAR